MRSQTTSDHLPLELPNSRDKSSAASIAAEPVAAPAGRFFSLALENPVNSRAVSSRPIGSRMDIYGRRKTAKRGAQEH